MKNKSAIASVFLAATSFSVGEIVVNDVFSFEGFVDMSYSYLNQETDLRGSSKIKESENNFGVDQAEIDWLLDFDPLTARIDTEFEEDGAEFQLEQAFVSYELDSKYEGSVITVGRYASMLGFEGYEQFELYQFSTAYGNAFSSVAGAQLGYNTSLNSDVNSFFDAIFFPVGERYSQGVRYTYENETSFFGFSLQDGTINYEGRLGGDGDTDGTAVDDGGYGFEIVYSYDCGSGFNFFVGGSYEIGDGLSYTDSNLTSFTTGDTETYIFNTYVTYEMGAWLFASELNFSQTELESINAGASADVESITWLIMANYVYNENSSVTGRISYMDLEYDSSGASAFKSNSFKYTVAHNYAFVDNILFTTELSCIFDSGDNDADINELLAAAQMIFVF